LNLGIEITIGLGLENNFLLILGTKLLDRQIRILIINFRKHLRTLPIDKPSIALATIHYLAAEETELLHNYQGRGALQKIGSRADK